MKDQIVDDVPPILTDLPFNESTSCSGCTVSPICGIAFRSITSREAPITLFLCSKCIITSDLARNNAFTAIQGIETAEIEE